MGRDSAVGGGIELAAGAGVELAAEAVTELGVPMVGEECWPGSTASGVREINLLSRAR